MTEANRLERSGSASEWLGPALDRALDRVEEASRALADFPHVTEAGEWVTYPDGVWTGGFWIGQLWLHYRVRRDEEIRRRAEHFLERYLPRRNEEQNHDLGMMFYPSAVVGWRLTGDERYRSAAIDAARALIAQAHPSAGFIPGWGFFGGDDWAGASLVDTLMNLPLVVWAAKQTGEEELERAAVKHADLSVANHLRPDGSAYHVFRFDPGSGAPLGGATYQGSAPDSRWSRGLGWAIAGLSMLGEALPKPEYLRAARRAADFYRANVPDDLVPYWDFDVDPRRSPAGEAGSSQAAQPRDSAAAAISSFGMQRLAAATEDAELERYALEVLRSLSQEYADAAPRHALLGHATADLPHGLGIDGATGYGDYYYLKCLVEAAHGRMDNAPSNVRT